MNMYLFKLILEFGFILLDEFFMKGNFILNNE